MKDPELRFTLKGNSPSPSSFHWAAGRQGNLCLDRHSPDSGWLCDHAMAQIDEFALAAKPASANSTPDPSAQRYLSEMPNLVLPEVVSHQTRANG
jgi:hypothetical protein